MDDLIPNEANFFLYTAPNGEVRVDVIIQDETVWLTQKSMGELFGVETNTITYHLGEIYKTGELEAEATTRKIRVVRPEGNRQVTRNIDFYNLDAIISVGYRVNSRQATQFRIWATKTLKEFLIKGFAMDDDRLKQGNTLFGKDYFKELLERVRSIRASERRIYQQITDIFAECSIDYDRNSELTKTFYATIQNKFHFAITGHTAAEIIYKKADSQKENMGLTTWKNSPDGRILKSDALVAKNYLSEKEIKQLERTVSGYFDYIENLIERRQTFTMAALAESVNKFLAFNEYHVLENAGKISKIIAEQKAVLEYDKYNKTQKIVSDFDKEVRKLQGENQRQA
ncbi:MAG TPA: virulence RhuM family protein [Adhaeribacter sp.]|nr:virulence RhuM family protein [Adhaeribacter sp.]